MSKIDDHIKALTEKTIAHAEHYPTDGDDTAKADWRTEFARLRDDREMLKHARGLIPPTGGSFPLNNY